MVVGESQWLGQGATQGHYVELTDVLNSELNLSCTHGSHWS
jgi:multiple sugar transport system substrate-binding protein